jgi:hypothetical protein
VSLLGQYSTRRDVWLCGNARSELLGVRNELPRLDRIVRRLVAANVATWSKIGCRSRAKASHVSSMLKFIARIKRPRRASAIVVILGSLVATVR